MMHKGTRQTSGNMPNDLRQQTIALLDAFDQAVEQIAEERSLRKAIVRSRRPCTLLALLDQRHLFIVAQAHLGIPTSIFIHEPEKTFTIKQAFEAAVFDVGLESPFAVAFPIALLTPNSPNWLEVIQAIAKSYVDSEYQRIHQMINTVQMRPIFGASAFSVDDRLVFVLMPFRDNLTEIYESIVKPTIEEIGFVCRRADDYKTNKAVMQDIWKAICEARIVVADMTT